MARHSIKNCQNHAKSFDIKEIYPTSGKSFVRITMHKPKAVIPLTTTHPICCLEIKVYHLNFAIISFLRAKPNQNSKSNSNMGVRRLLC